MDIQFLPFDTIPQLSSKDIAYATENPRLRPFFQYDVKLETFAKVIQDKMKDATNRDVLVEVLKNQYKKFESSNLINQQIESLNNSNTFTVTTAHQPSLCTGPLYYIYKIFSTINLSEQLKQTYPDYHFVPVFITGGEDHDFEEVNHFNLFGKKIIWENEEMGSVGMMQTHTLQPVLEELKTILGTSPKAEEIYQIIETAYTKHQKYADATIELAHTLFQDYGLVILDMNNRSLKSLFANHLKKELFEQTSKALVEATKSELEAVGFSGQAHARDINLFYLKDQLRERIVRENGVFQVLNTDYTFTETEILQELEQNPHHFSPNVVIRPLYQEFILPNLAYIGGGGEIAYWLERKIQFTNFGINFPMLIRRNSVLWLDKGNSKKMAKLGLSINDLFIEVEALIKHFVSKHTNTVLSLAEEKASLNKVFQAIKEKSDQIDPTLSKAVLAEGAKQMKSLEQLEGRLMRAEKQKHETSINQIRSLKEKLFPGNGLQERHDNFMNLYLKYGNSFFETLKANLNPLKKGFVVIQDR